MYKFKRRVRASLATHLLQTGLPDDIFNSLPESVRYYIRFLESCIQQLEKRIQEQDSKIHELEARLSKNSSHSSKPPGSDGLNNPLKLLAKEPYLVKIRVVKMVKLEKGLYKVEFKSSTRLRHQNCKNSS